MGTLDSKSRLKAFELQSGSSATKGTRRYWYSVSSLNEMPGCLGGERHRGWHWKDVGFGHNWRKTSRGSCYFSNQLLIIILICESNTKSQTSFTFRLGFVPLHSSCPLGRSISCVLLHCRWTLSLAPSNSCLQFLTQIFEWLQLLP